MNIRDLASLFRIATREADNATEWRGGVRIERGCVYTKCRRRTFQRLSTEHRERRAA